MIDQLTDWLHAYLMNNEPQVTPRGLAVALLDSFQVTAFSAAHGVHNGVPDDFWREVPCGHPQDPVAALTDDGHWVCHCGWALDPADAVSSGEDEGAPGPIVPCGKCGCYPALAASGASAHPERSEGALTEELDALRTEAGRLREQLDAARRSFERIIENLDGENEDGNIFPQAAERIARAALGDEAAGGYAADGSTSHKSDQGGALGQKASETRADADEEARG